MTKTKSRKKDFELNLPTFWSKTPVLTDQIHGA